ncbi:hypothetical protein ABKN59_005143 [Abortiporus biennis]
MVLNQCFERSTFNLMATTMFSSCSLWSIDNAACCSHSHQANTNLYRMPKHRTADLNYSSPPTDFQSSKTEEARFSRGGRIFIRLTTSTFQTSIRRISRHAVHCTLFSIKTSTTGTR